MKIITLIFSLIILQSCTTQVARNQILVEANSNTFVNKVNHIKTNASLHKIDVKNVSDVENEKKDKNKEFEIEPYDIKNTIGLVSATDKLSEKGNSIRIYNQDGSIWYKFTNTRDSHDMGVISFNNENLRPFRYNADELLLVLKCVGQDKNYYHVIVNDETGLKKFIRKDDQIFRFGSWGQYILDCFAVTFDSNKNPLREEPNGKVFNAEIQGKPYFHTEKIEGDWLKVRWYNINNYESKPNFAWVRWRKDQNIIIYFFEIA